MEPEKELEVAQEVELEKAPVRVREVVLELAREVVQVRDLGPDLAQVLALVVELDQAQDQQRLLVP